MSRLLSSICFLLFGFLGSYYIRGLLKSLDVQAIPNLDAKHEIFNPSLKTPPEPYKGLMLIHHIGIHSIRVYRASFESPLVLQVRP